MHHFARVGHVLHHQPDSILVNGHRADVDCPGCCAVCATATGWAEACEGAFKACARLAVAERARRLRDHAEALVLTRAKQEGRAQPTGDDARQVLEELTQIRGEVAAIAGELDRKTGR